jgi:mannose-6-phosphate isomerase
MSNVWIMKVEGQPRVLSEFTMQTEGARSKPSEQCYFPGAGGQRTRCVRAERSITIPMEEAARHVDRAHPRIRFSVRGIRQVNLAPSRLAPVFVRRIWGVRSLAPLFDLRAQTQTPSDERIGEVWLTGDQCVFCTGPLAGQRLGEVWPALPADWTGRRGREAPRIPLLLKFIFPEEYLSVQVHPDDEYAREHEAAAGGTGKTELWYTVTAQEGAELRLGFEPGVTAEKFQRAIGEGKAEECLERVTVHAGDAFFVPAGTPHTIGPGMVLCEIQQYSDLTYRVFDYNRVAPDGNPRPLHIRQAFEVMKFGVGLDDSRGRIDPVQIQFGPILKTYFAACRYFAVERWQFSECVTASTSLEQFELLVILAGAGRIEWGRESVDYRAGGCWFLPAALGAYKLAPTTAMGSSTTLLRAYNPDLQEFRQHLASQKIGEAAIKRVVHP